MGQWGVHVLCQSEMAQYGARAALQNRWIKKIVDSPLVTPGRITLKLEGVGKNNYVLLND